MKLLIRGMGVGITEAVPGVSGSTIAMILGIYERLVYSLSILTTSNRKQAYPFLAVFGLGMLIGLGISIYMVEYLLDAFPAPTMIFFGGIIAGFLPFLWKDAHAQSNTKAGAKFYLILLAFFSLVTAGQFFGGGSSIDAASLTMGNYIYLLCSGIIASTALVLPGISGALILTILGLYELILDAVIHVHLPVALTVGTGLVLGVLLTSRIVRYLLRRFPQGTYAAMVGLVAGSLVAIYRNIDKDLSTGLIFASFTSFTAGLLLVLLLVKFSRPDKMNRKPA